MAFGYPIMLELAGRRSVVIGADAVRDGKVESLLAAGADDVVVIAPEPSAMLDDLEPGDRGSRCGDAHGVPPTSMAPSSWSRPVESPASAMRSRERPVRVERS